MRTLGASTVAALFTAALSISCSDSTTADGGGATAGAAGATGSAGAAGAAGAGGMMPVGANPYPDPAAWEPNGGPGGPATEFTQSQLFEHCAFLSGDPDKTLDITQHHNLVVMYDGYLLMPWAPERGGGGLTFFDVSDACDPVEVGRGYSEQMRETHSIGFSDIDGRWAVVDGIIERDVVGAGGVQFWDLSDVRAPKAVSDLTYDSFFYPDAYARVVLSVFWQGKYVYAAAGDTGLLVIDAEDPTNPKLVNTVTFDPVLRAGQVQAVGNLLMIGAASVGRTALLDISDPADPQPIPGGEYMPAGGLYYFTNFANGYIYYARNDLFGGLFVYDINDPSNPTMVGEAGVILGGAGGYVFVKDQYAFTGQSDFFVLFDISDHANITEVNRMTLQGDMDTMTPIGNVAVLSVDDGACAVEGSCTPTEFGTAIAPWTTEVDTAPPKITWSWPHDGATGLATTSRIGVSASEFISVKSGWEGSVRLYETGTVPGDTRVDGYVNVQELIINFTPAEPLRPGTEYTFEIPAGGLTDYNGNAIEEPFQMTFTTAG